jgi:hypothetical protein
MKVFWVKDGLPEGNISNEDMRKFQGLRIEAP